MMRSQVNDASLRPARNRPFATRGVHTTETGTAAESGLVPIKTTLIQVELTPEEERICDRATD